MLAHYKNIFSNAQETLKVESHAANKFKGKRNKMCMKFIRNFLKAFFLKLV